MIIVIIMCNIINKNKKNVYKFETKLFLEGFLTEDLVLS